MPSPSSSPSIISRLQALPLEKTIATALVIGVSLAFLLCVGGYFTLAHLRESNAWTAHTSQVLLTTENIENALINAETGQRGYLLTGKKNYLLPYERARTDASARIETFLSLVADSPEQTQTGLELQRLANDKLSELKRTVQTFDDGGRDAALAIVLQDQGEKWMTEIRALTATITERENALLQSRVATADAAFSRAVFVFVAALVLYGLFALASFLIIRRELRQRRSAERELRASEARIRAITNNLPALIVYVDSDERYRFCNQHVQNVFGVGPDRLVGATMREIAGATLYTEIEPHIREVLRGNPVSFDGSHTARGQLIHHHSEYIPDIDDDGKVRGFYALSFDITARKAAEDALFQEHERAEVTLSSIGDAVMTTDAEGRISYLNPIAELMTGWDDVSARGLPLEDVFRVINVDTREKVVNPLAQAMQENRIVELAADSLLITKTGTEIAIEDSAAPIRDRSRNVIGGVLVFRDVSEMRALAVRMARMAHHDALTDLPNRLLLRDRLAQAITVAARNKQKLAVLFCDLDRFKQVNDSLGHAYGDALLKEVALRLTRCVRASDTVSRQGGDEFLILLQDVTDTASIAVTAEKIRAAICTPFDIQDHVVHIGVSIGISIFPDDGADQHALIKHADAAMYEAKNNGRDRFQFFTEVMNANTQQRYELENDLRNAIAQDDFNLHYQPKFDFLTGDLVGAEALLRWPQGAIKGHTTQAFIQFAEETGLIHYIGAWVLQETCEQIKRWLDAGYKPLPISVNVSALQIRQRNFAEQVAGIASAAAISPSLLELEITESMLIDAEDGAIEQMQKLRDLGVRLSIDDFGTGYSSLMYLKKFPINTLKIDRAFVSEMATSRHSAAITLAIITLAKSLALEVVAEGVETIDQAEMIFAQGCQIMQGYLFARPLSQDQFEILLRDGGQAQQLRAPVMDKHGMLVD
jgi:diguanylate cyclase (GGDEF)-like protein/PAS domain S-box-containing protein